MKIEEAESLELLRDLLRRAQAENYQLKRSLAQRAGELEIARHQRDIAQTERRMYSDRNWRKVVRQGKAIVKMEKQIEELKKERHELLGQLKATGAQKAPPRRKVR